jgi:hypothetical protein
MLLHAPLINPFKHLQEQPAYEPEANRVPARTRVIGKMNLRILLPRLSRGVIFQIHRNSIASLRVSSTPAA